MLTAEQIAEKTAVLKSLEGADLQYALGENAIEVMIDGNRTVFEKAYPGKREQWIKRLKAELAPYDATINGEIREFTVRNNRMFL